MAESDKLRDLLLLDRDQVATWLNVDPATIDTLHRMGRLIGFRVGKPLRWRPRDVERFVDALSEAEA